MAAVVASIVTLLRLSLLEYGSNIKCHVSKFTLLTINNWKKIKD